MPRKRPVEGVIIEYFQTIDMPNAARMMAVCNDIVKRRLKEIRQDKPTVVYPKQKEQ